MMENLKRVLLQAPVVCDYLDSGPANPERLYVLLHGYDQTAKTAAREFTPALSATATWLAPNAPFQIGRAHV